MAKAGYTASRRLLDAECISHDPAAGTAALEMLTSPVISATCTQSRTNGLNNRRSNRSGQLFKAEPHQAARAAPRRAVPRRLTITAVGVAAIGLAIVLTVIFTTPGGRSGTPPSHPSSRTGSGTSSPTAQGPELKLTVKVVPQGQGLALTGSQVKVLQNGTLANGGLGHPELEPGIRRERASWPVPGVHRPADRLGQRGPHDARA